MSDADEIRHGSDRKRSGLQVGLDLLGSEFFKPMKSSAVYGCYRGRENDNDLEIIYINKEILNCSKFNENFQNTVKYSAVILFTIIHELGHWCFHHFSCDLNDEIATPKGVLLEEAGEALEMLIFGFKIQHYGPTEPKLLIDDVITQFNSGYRIIPINYLKSLFQLKTYKKNPGSLSIQIKLLREAVILQEELLKFNCKVVFNPIDEPLLSTTTAPTDNFVMNTIGKRIFHSCDKNY